MKVTVKQLKELPVRDWNQTTAYDSNLVYKEGGKHESGWARMMVVGCNNQKPVEVCSECSDDIVWSLRAYGMRTDMIYPSGMVHFWGRDIRFVVGESLSSIDIEVIEVTDN